jgi:predicted nucleotidyltransferase
MGIQSHPLQSTATGLASVLFTPVQQRVLGLLFGQPDRRFQGAEVIRLAGSGTGAVHRLLTRLAASGLVTVERIGNQKHYQANRASPVFAELHGLVKKTSGLLIPLRTALLALEDQIVSAFVYGSVAKGIDQASSDIDLMVISDSLAYSDLFTALQPAEAQLARTINANLMTLEEWRRKREGSGFANRISTQERFFVVGSAHDID